MKTKPITAKIATAVIGLSLAASAVAGLTDLSTSPLVTSSSSSVLPNIFLMMDDSGSMNWDYMPDVGNNPVFGTSKYGYASNQCNGVFYNPAIKYLPPITYDGVTSYSNASFTGAWMDGYKTSLGTLNLSTGFTLGLYQSYSAPGGGVPAYYYNYLGTQTADSQKNYYKSTTTFYKECNTTAADNPTATLTVSGSGSTSVTSITVNGVSIMSGASTANTSTSTVAANIAAKITAAGYSATASGSTVTITGPASAAAILPVVTQTGGMSIAPSAFTPFAKVVVSATSGPGGTDERQNFANWFSYYRTRINMMKSGTGFAFRSLDNHYRVGFATMNNNGGSKFLNLATFDATQKQNWYTMLYSTSVNNSTPLLKALSNVGRMYGNKLTTLNGVAVSDPMQYSCQQNFTILSTDGFWNDATNYDLNGNKVNNQDGDQPRPYNDGATSTVTEATPTSSTVRNQTDTPKTVTIKWSRDSITTDATKGGGTCTNKKYRVTTQNQFY
ncbi:MAG: hypothetical protein JSS58_11670, partial [Proteobacteria bacterium]|nr:hypothetical protein [Pseudomonadota bacterium]